MPDDLTTERLRLRRFTPADADLLVELDSDPAVMRYLSGGDPTPRAVVEREVLPRFLLASARPGFGYWAAHELASGAFLGWFGFHPTTDGDPREAVLGYRLRQSAWGRGYATEGSRALIERGFRELGVERVIATTYQDNVASRRVMEKLGLTFVRAYRLTAEALAAEGTFDTSGDVWDGDDVEYALTRAEWERQQAGG